jgi:copper homeostasis protein
MDIYRRNHDRMTLEVCIDGLDTLVLARKYGAKRVELCSALELGGLTPSLGMVECCIEASGIEIHAMLRPRGGHFVYTQMEMEIMRKDMDAMAQVGIHGIVFGCLNERNEIDTEACRFLIAHAKDLGLEVTFHRAFDMLNDPEAGLEELIELGFDRILTSGGESKANDGLGLIKRCVEIADGRIQIMAGSGVNASNALHIAHSGVDALHFTSHKTESKDSFGMGAQNIPDEEKIAGICELFT